MDLVVFNLQTRCALQSKATTGTASLISGDQQLQTKDILARLYYCSVTVTRHCIRFMHDHALRVALFSLATLSLEDLNDAKDPVNSKEAWVWCPGLSGPTNLLVRAGLLIYCTV